MPKKKRSKFLIPIVLIFIIITALIIFFAVREAAFPELTTTEEFWKLSITDQTDSMVYNEGDDLKILATVLQGCGDYPRCEPGRCGGGDLFTGSGYLWYGSPPRRRNICWTPDLIFNNENYQADVDNIYYKLIPGYEWVDAEAPGGDACAAYCPYQSACEYCYPNDYKATANDCGPYIFCDGKLKDYDEGACMDMTPGFHEIEWLGWFSQCYSATANYYGYSDQVYLKNEIYVIPDPCELTVDQTLVLEGPFTNSFSSADLTHSVDKFCSRFAPLVFNDKLGFAYSDIALERFYKLKYGETITPKDYEEIYVFYVTSDFGIACEEDEAYSSADEECVRPSGLLNVIQCDEGTLEVQEDGSVLCLKQGEVYIVCPEGSKFDQELQVCVSRETEIECIQGTWDEEKQKCMVDGERDYTCEGIGWSYDYNLDRCVSDDVEPVEKDFMTYFKYFVFAIAGLFVILLVIGIIKKVLFLAVISALIAIALPVIYYIINYFV